jgi:alpha-D-ribose 1-methylphosphonate 5-triphosphate synthase subunit PhnH
MDATLDGGFADAVLDAQVSFRALMDALANPGLVQRLRAPAHPYALPVGLAAVALTLCDHDCEVWVDPSLAADAAVTSWLRFQTGAPMVGEPRKAQFAFATDAMRLPKLDAFSLGSDEYPDRSTTIALALPSLVGGSPLALRGPGIKDTRTIAPTGLPDEFVPQWTANRELFPRGIDLLLVAGSEVIGLPRTTRIAEA